MTGSTTTLRPVQVIAYSAVIWPMLVGAAPVNVFLTPYYSQILGFSLASVGLVMLYGRIFDMCTSIVVGYLSDKTKSRLGRRRPWIIGSVPVFLIAVWLISVPGPDMTMTRLALYLSLFYIAFTGAYVPYLTQGSEITADQSERTSINLLQGAIILAGIVSSVALPFIFLDKRTEPWRMALGRLLADAHVGRLGGLIDLLMTPAIVGPANFGRSMLLMAIVTSIALPLFVAVYLYFVRGPALAESKALKSPASFMAAFRNPVFQKFAIGHFFIQTAMFANQSLIAFILIFSLRIPDMLLVVILVETVFSIICTPLWGRLVRRIGRPRSIAVGAFTKALGFVALWFVPPGNETALICAALVIALPGQSLVMLPYLVAADAAEYAEWRTGKESHGLHVSVVSFIIKLGWVLGALSVSAAGLFGFSPSHPVNSAWSLAMLKFLGIGLPILLLIAGGLLVSRFPITTARHVAIRARLERRAFR
jgi:Na+/melibiose symporter-like transporter